jgi:hypothetical protein
MATYTLVQPVVTLSAGGLGSCNTTTTTLPARSVVEMVSQPRRAGVVPVLCNRLHYDAFGADAEANSTLNEPSDSGMKGNFIVFSGYPVR